MNRVMLNVDPAMQAVQEAWGVVGADPSRDKYGGQEGGTGSV